MLHMSVITSLQTDTYIDELIEIFLKLSMKTVQVHLIIWTTFNMLQNFTLMETRVLEIAGRVWKSPSPPLVNGVGTKRLCKERVKIF